MHPTLRCAAVITPRPHVPLIRFLGKRSLLPAVHTAAASAQPTLPAGAIQLKNNVVGFNIEQDQLPLRFRYKSISLEEIELIETGGAAQWDRKAN